MCNWQNCLSGKFADKAALARHLQRHASAPLRCAYEGAPPIDTLAPQRPSLTSRARVLAAGCEQVFGTAEALLRHHREKKHRAGALRAPTLVPRAPGAARELPPLPDVVPAYMSVTRRVSQYPISRERHQWLGPKVSVLLRSDVPPGAVRRSVLVSPRSRK